MAQIDVSAKSKIAPRSPVASIILIDKDRDGKVLGTEFKKQMPGQQVIVVDKESGEVKEPKLDGLKLVKNN